jgi:uncharacterized protein (TIGR03435 family)
MTRIASKLRTGSALCIFQLLQIAAQTPPPPAFDAASVKPSQPGARGVSVIPARGGLRTENAPVASLIETAYRVHPFQVTGGPAWIHADGFDINARTASTVTTAQIRPMLQTLLAERFKLRFHRETRDLPAYRLIVAKNGPKLPLSPPGACPDADKQDRTHPCGGFRLSNRSHLYGERVEIADFVEELQFALGRAIFDHTAPTGRYTIKLDWTPDERLFSGLGSEHPDAPLGDMEGASLLTALQEQLGLKLESFKGPVPIIVIDSVEKPSAN